MNVLILGSSGLLGKNIYYKLKEYKIFKIFHNGISKRKENLLKLKNLEKILKKSNPELIINSMAMANIDFCEKNKKISRSVNVETVKNIFFLKMRNNLKFNLIQFSTDQVYDSKYKYRNKETSRPVINNEYAKQKSVVEKICMRNKSLILRINFFGKSFSKNTSLTDWIYKSFKSNKKFYLFDDVLFNPVRIQTISNIIFKIIYLKKYDERGIFNVGTRDGISKSDFAIYFAKKLRIYNKKYSLVGINNYLKTKRSKNTIMCVNKLEKLLNINMPSIRTEIFKELKVYKKNAF